MVSRNPDEVLNDTLLTFTQAIGESLDDVCSYGLTIGETYVPFDPDPEDDCETDDDAPICTQAWVRVMGVSVINTEPADFDGNPGPYAELSLDLEVGIIRCLTIPEDGEAPTASDMLVAATQSMSDMRAIYCAAMDLEVWDSITVGQWTPTGPLGGQYGGIWTFTVTGPCAPPIGGE